MERVKTLILKLQQQLEEKATAEKLLLTVQMLHAELSPKIFANRPEGSGKVIVIMPAITETKQPYQAYNNVAESREPVLAEEEKIIEVLQVDEKEIEEELEQIKKNAESKNKISVNAKPFLLFDPVEDVPTLTHKTPEKNAHKDINETVK